MRIDILALAELIGELTWQRNKLVANKEVLEEIKKIMDKAWDNDSRWETEGSKVVTRIIENTDKMIVVFSKQINSLDVWLSEIMNSLKND